MSTSIKGALAAVALTGLLGGCATYDYGYGYAYDAPYYGYGYDHGPYYYGYGPYTYGPGYEYGAPSVGFTLGLRNDDRHARHDRGRHVRSYRRGHDRGNVHMRQHANLRPMHANASARQHERIARARERASTAPAVPRAPAAGSRRAAQATMRAEQ
jgi:hypothetical protein